MEEQAMNTTHWFLTALGAGALVATLTGCAGEYEGFALPPGDATRGQEAFVHFRCYDCHTVSGVDLPVGEEPDQVKVELGGVVDRVRTYDDLVTAIINPSHRLAQGYAETLVAPAGKSRMTNYNDVMTVSQLVDLVTFLQKHYELYVPETTYPQYYGP
jgi:sulfur-oxidizing protein SoxX